MINFASGSLVEGHGVASGKTHDSRFPMGTLAMQIPLFEVHGGDFGGFHHGTLNVLLEKFSYELKSPKYNYKLVKWSPHLPPENFSFYACSLKISSCDREFDSLVYWPHPSTKPEFHQSDQVLEVISPFIAGAHYGDSVEIIASPKSILFRSKNSRK